MTQREHIVTLPDSYIGSADSATDTLSIVNPTGDQIRECTASYNRGLYKIVDELFVNAWDQKVRIDGENAQLAKANKSSKSNKSKTNKSKKAKLGVSQAQSPLRTVTRVDISIDPDTNALCVRNDGEGIDIAMHPEHNVYTVELIFGHLLTSTNYHKGEKLTGGKNGYGAKLANVFSTRFEVTTVDAKTGQMYTQVFTNNMLNKSTPTIVAYDGEPFTQVKVIPDFVRFGMPGWTDPMIRLLKKRAFDLSACAGAAMTVTFDGVVVPVQSMTSYMSLFEGIDHSDGSAFSQALNERWEVGVCLSENGFQQQSFVNGVWTIRGGKHVDYILQQIAKHVCDTIEKKEKIKVKPVYVRDHLMLFVKAMIVNPAFDGQTKETLTTPASKFGSKCELPKEFMDRVYKLGLVERVIEHYQYKEQSKAKKDEGKKRGRISGIPKLDDANKAGTKEGHLCTLILTEGDSAKAMAVAGLSEVGRDYYGVFPLRGKMINARDKMTTTKGLDQMYANEEMSNLKKILGLVQGKVYTQANMVKDLRYGKVMIMTDQDVDGSHIKGLFMNWIDSQWKELMALDFVTAMNTPIIKAKKGKQEMSFYSIGQYEQWRETSAGQQTGWSIKYYKGLGTSTTKEAKEYFRDLKQVNYFLDDVEHTTTADATTTTTTADATATTTTTTTDAATTPLQCAHLQCERLDLAFAKHRADDRKAWMADYDIQNVLDTSLPAVSYTDFVDKELKHFSIYDTQRSIGNVIDGLKPSQRKILFACFKREKSKGSKEVKVAQLAGYVSENTGYHHGEQSLNDAIVGMAQTFLASNNMNLLLPNGQFGTRLQGGKDAASPRYIFTKLNSLTPLLYHPDDQPLLEYLDDDGQTVEPRYYVPVLPVTLMNGVHGVGTGYSTSVPMYNPMEICDAFLGRLKKVVKEQAKHASQLAGTVDSAQSASTTSALSFAPPVSDPIAPFPTLHPSYNGFTGKIIQLNAKSYLTKGKYSLPDYKTIVIHELPIGVWTDDYKVFLETLLVDYTPPKKKTKTTKSSLSAKNAKRKYPGVLKHYTSHCTESTVHFELEFKPDVLMQWTKVSNDDPNIDNIEKQLRLTTKVSLTNMHLFDAESRIHRYDSVSDIMEAFYSVRLDYYGRRRAHQLGVLQHELDVLTYKIKFIEAVIADDITVAKQTKSQLIEILETKGYPKFALGDQTKTPSYHYLITMPIYSLTTDTLDALRKMQEEKAKTLAALEGMTSEGLWVNDLKGFRKELQSTLNAMAKAVEKEKKEKMKKAKGGKGGKAGKGKGSKKTGNKKNVKGK